MKDEISGISGLGKGYGKGVTEGCARATEA
jgi:hypothetical protein